MRRGPWIVMLAVTACADPGSDAPPIVIPRPPMGSPVDEPSTEADPVSPPPRADYAALGARFDGDELLVRLRSLRASRIQLELYRAARDEAPVLALALTPGADGIHSARIRRDRIPGSGALYYGLRAFGPNWPYVETWTPGSLDGFVAWVDEDGNRFDPNKLVVDPYALELSHDPVGPDFDDGSIYRSGADDGARDSGPKAPKGVILDLGASPPRRIERPLKDEVIYEVHVRGLTMSDPSIPEAWRGTYRGAAEKADYLAELGVTAIELLPVLETQNDQNDREPGTAGDNYWGYSSLSFFAPDRRYAADRSPGGPTRELTEMVAAFHDRGLKVYLDLVYNHTGEGGVGGDQDIAEILSWRGLDNAGYYLLSDDGRRFSSHNGVGPDFSSTSPIARDLVIDSLEYLHQVIGVDGFRFDLASVLANKCVRGCFEWDAGDPQGILRRIAAELPARPFEGGPGVDLIAEPWGIGDGTYRIGQFPAGWSEWNGQFRDRIRADQNLLGIEDVTPRALSHALLGSPELYADDGRPASASINFVDCHDGFTLADLYRYQTKQNDQPWPRGPSTGGEDHNRSWDHGGDTAAQRQAARTGLALVLLASGVPMIQGGDERLRTQFGNNNPYNLDSPTTWIDWGSAADSDAFARFTRALLQFRREHPALRFGAHFSGNDGDGDGLADVGRHRDDGGIADGGYLDDPSRHFLGLRFDGDELGDPAASIYVAYNGWSGGVQLTLPSPRPDLAWFRIADTSDWMEPEGNFSESATAHQMGGRSYDLGARALALFIEAPATGGGGG